MDGLHGGLRRGASAAPIRHGPQRVGFKQTNPVAAPVAATASPMASVLLPAPPLREIKAIVCMARVSMACVLPKCAMTHHSLYMHR